MSKIKVTQVNTGKEMEYELNQSFDQYSDSDFKAVICDNEHI